MTGPCGGPSPTPFVASPPEAPIFSTAKDPDMSTATLHDPAAPAAPVPLPVQILTVIFYAAFAITVSILAMVFFGIIGIAVALLLALQWGRIAALGGTQNAGCTAARPAAEDTPPPSSGNAAFDAYRDEIIARLRAEQADFEAFVETLRAAKDKAELDAFLAERAQAPGDRSSPTREA